MAKAMANFMAKAITISKATDMAMVIAVAVAAIACRSRKG